MISNRKLLIVPITILVLLVATMVQGGEWTRPFGNTSINIVVQNITANAGVAGWTVNGNFLFNDTPNTLVGIGTTSPTSKLHIKANTPGTVGSHPAGQLIIQDPDDTVFGNAVITGYESDGSGNPDQQLWYLGSSSSSNSNIIFLNRRNALLQFGTSGSTRMTILGNGNVGIGTTSPGVSLEVGDASGEEIIRALSGVNGDAILSANSFSSTGNPLTQYIVAGGNNWVTGVDNGDSDKYKISFHITDLGTNNFLTVQTDGNVGIGTTTPFNTLHVTGDGNFSDNVTAANLFVPSYWFGHDNHSEAAAGASIWTNVTFSDEDKLLSAGIQHTAEGVDNFSFKIDMAGIYEFDYFLTFVDTAPNPNSDVGARVTQNGAEVPGSVQETDLTKRNAEVELSGEALVDSAAGDNFAIQFISNSSAVLLESHQNFGENPSSAVLIIKRIS